jgi:uncharacterized YccA/Bax inhibitor family protein
VTETHPLGATADGWPRGRSMGIVAVAMGSLLAILYAFAGVHYMYSAWGLPLADASLHRIGRWMLSAGIGALVCLLVVALPRLNRCARLVLGSAALIGLCVGAVGYHAAGKVSTEQPCACDEVIP